MNIKPLFAPSVFEKKDLKADAKKGIKEGSKKDTAIDKKSMGTAKATPKAKNPVVTMRDVYGKGKKKTA